MILCKKCSIEISIRQYSGFCKKCRKHKNYLDTNGLNRPRFVSKSKEEKASLNKKTNAEWYLKNKDKVSQSNKLYREANFDILKVKNKEWHENNPDYRKNKYKNNIKFKIKCILRARLNAAIKINQKSGSAVDDLGCSIEEFKIYLESKFEPWMNWENHGKYSKTKQTWHIDHIIPLDNFNLENREEFLKACHFSNLQPLLAKSNLSKGSKLDFVILKN